MLAMASASVIRSVPQSEETIAMAKINPLTFEDVAAKLAYNPETGIFT